MTRLIPVAILALAAGFTLASTATAATPEAHVKAAKAHVGDCCIDAAKASQGCCGKDSSAIEAKYADYQLTKKAQAAVMANTHACCAKALTAGTACCGKDAKALKADYDKKVAKKTKALVMAY